MVQFRVGLLEKIISVYTCIHKFRRPPARKGPSPLSIWYISIFSIRPPGDTFGQVKCLVRVNTFLRIRIIQFFFQ